MSEPMSDPTAVILARMEVKLDNALAEQTRHSTVIERHDRILNEHGNRLTAVETHLAADEKTTDGRTSNRVAFWSMIAALAACATVIVYVVLASKG